MLVLNSTSVLQITTSAAAQIEVHASYADLNTSTGAVDINPQNTAAITTATTTTVVASPGAGVKRNVKNLNITNDHASVACVVAVEHSDGTTVSELIGVVLAPGENMVYSEDGRWTHYDANGAPYPPAGLGNFGGFSTPIYKTGTAPEAVGFWYCSSKDAGFPGAWSPGTPGVNGRVTNGQSATDNGCIRLKNALLGSSFLTDATLAGSVAQTHLLMDVLWVNTGLSPTTTTEQAIATPALPARDVNGGTDGVGCMIGILFTAAGGAAQKADTTVRYTNSAGVANRTATLFAVAGSQIPATPVIGTLVWFRLQDGDTGVRSIEGFTNVTTMTSGTFSLIIARWIDIIPCPVPNIAINKKATASGVRLYNGTCMLHALQAASATATNITGSVTVEEK